MSDNPNSEVLAAIEALGARLDAKIDGIDAKVDRLGADVTRFRTDVTRFRTDIMERIDRLQARVDAMHSDVKVSEGAANLALQQIENDRAENRQLASMQVTLNRMLRAARNRIDKLEDKGDAAA
jgi:outer membrane murein-binding lipoprotein Lpp